MKALWPHQTNERLLNEDAVLYLVATWPPCCPLTTLITIGIRPNDFIPLQRKHEVTCLEVLTAL